MLRVHPAGTCASHFFLLSFFWTPWNHHPLSFVLFLLPSFLPSFIFLKHFDLRGVGLNFHYANVVMKTPQPTTLCHSLGIHFLTPPALILPRGQPRNVQYCWSLPSGATHTLLYVSLSHWLPRCFLTKIQTNGGQFHYSTVLLHLSPTSTSTAQPCLISSVPTNEEDQSAFVKHKVWGHPPIQF